jgi:hypothetical protein
LQNITKLNTITRINHPNGDYSYSHSVSDNPEQQRIFSRIEAMLKRSPGGDVIDFGKLTYKRT